MKHQPGRAWSTHALSTNDIHAGVARGHPLPDLKHAGLTRRKFRRIPEAQILLERRRLCLQEAHGIAAVKIVHAEPSRFLHPIRYVQIHHTGSASILGTAGRRGRVTLADAPLMRAPRGSIPGRPQEPHRPDPHLGPRKPEPASSARCTQLVSNRNDNGAGHRRGPTSVGAVRPHSPHPSRSSPFPSETRESPGKRHPVDRYLPAARFRRWRHTRSSAITHDHRSTARLS